MIGQHRFRGSIYGQTENFLQQENLSNIMENCFNFPDILEYPSLQAPDQNHNSTEDSHVTSDTKGMTIHMITTVEQSLTGYGNRIIDRGGGWL